MSQVFIWENIMMYIMIILKDIVSFIAITLWYEFIHSNLFPWFQILPWSNSKVQAALFSLLNTALYKRKLRDVCKIVSAYSVVQTLYWKCLMHSTYCAQTALSVFGASADSWMSHRLIHFFHWIKLLYSSCLVAFWSYFNRDFHEHNQTISFFCLLWIKLMNLHLLLLGKCDKSINALAMNLMLVQCAQPSGFGALDASKFSARALDSTHFILKNKCILLTSNVSHAGTDFR